MHGAAAAEAINHDLAGQYPVEQVAPPHLRLVAEYGELIEPPPPPEDELAKRRRDRYAGHVAVESLEARYDAVTDLAELTDGQMRSEFELTFDNDDLYGPDGRSLTKTCIDGLHDAIEKAEKNPNLWFDVDRRSEELEEIFVAVDMIKTGSGNTMMVKTNYPKVLKETGQTAPGYNDERELALARFITVNPGRIRLINQTLDGSNEQGLDAIDAEFGFETDPDKEHLGQRRIMTLTAEEQKAVADRATSRYDRELEIQFGEEFYAGRRPVDYRNTFDFVCQQHDLIDTYVELKLSDKLTDTIMYNLAATINARFEKHKVISREQAKGNLNVLDINEARQTSHDSARLYEEMAREGRLARSQGKDFVACGSTFTAAGADESTEALLKNAGYSVAGGEKSWHGGRIHKNTKCVSCEKVKSEVGACKICKDCVDHPKKGKLGTVQGRTGDPKKAKVNKESAKILSFEAGRKAREERRAKTKEKTLY